MSFFFSEIAIETKNKQTWFKILFERLVSEERKYICHRFIIYGIGGYLLIFTRHITQIARDMSKLLLTWVG